MQIYLPQSIPYIKQRKCINAKHAMRKFLNIRLILRFSHQMPQTDKAALQFSNQERHRKQSGYQASLKYNRYIRKFAPTHEVEALIVVIDSQYCGDIHLAKQCHQNIHHNARNNRTLCNNRGMVRVHPGNVLYRTAGMSGRCNLTKWEK